MARKSGFSIGNIAEILSAGKDSERRRTAQLNLLVLVDSRASRELIEPLKTSLVPALLSGNVVVESLDNPFPHNKNWDAVLIIPGSSCERAMAQARFAISIQLPCALIVESLVDIASAVDIDTLPPRMSILAASSAQVLLDKLASWLLSELDQKSLAVAANFEFCRDEMIQRLINSCALQNAAVGAISLIPGADLPIMTVRQAQLALDIAAAQGKELKLERAADLCGVLGAAFVYRSVARTLVGLVPGIGWMLKGGVAYVGTQATGRALAARFNPRNEQRLEKLTKKLVATRAKAMQSKS